MFKRNSFKSNRRVMRSWAQKRGLSKFRAQWWRQRRYRRFIK